MMTRDNRRRLSSTAKETGKAIRSKSLDRYLRRSACTAAAGLGAFGLAPQAADAAITVVDPPDFGGHVGWTNADGIDIDGNGGLGDVGIYRGALYGGYLVVRDEMENVGGEPYGPVATYGSGQLLLLDNPDNPDQGIGACCNQGAPLQGFIAGEVIGDNEAITSPSNHVMRAAYSQGDWDHITTPIDDGITPSYLGFQITGLSTGTGTGFGWLELIVDDDDPDPAIVTYTATRWAYSDDGSTIAAGDTGPIPCDFNGDQACDIDDLNAMLTEGPIAGGVAVTPGVNDQFDLNGDNLIDNGDRDLWLAGAATQNGLGSPYKIGDANLDGSVDVSDFNNWNAAKFTSTLNWDNGDFNSDGSADVSDFNAWNSNKFQSSDGISTVPEPSALGISMLAALALGAGGLAQRKRRPRNQ